ncbi:phenylalanine--tRNA ligase subunit alpha [Candidatus Woesearchaeota archaeon]|nr:MAG: phenylalanine--tRNA ligase subunit alpha [Candidatus Woesearchaeota archaeon]
MNIKELAASLHPLERKVLPHLQKKGTLAALAKASSLQEVEAMRALQWLEGKGCVTITTEEEEGVAISKKGQQAHKLGLPEEHVIKALKQHKELTVSAIPHHLPPYDRGATGAVIGVLKKLGLPFITTKEGAPAFKWVDAVAIKEPPAKQGLAEASKREWWLPITPATKSAAEDILRRKGYGERQKRKLKRYALTKLGVALTEQRDTKTYEEKLTHAMLKDGTWQQKTFRPYNVEINVPRIHRGRKHFVNEAIESIKRIWLDMGFTEMTGTDVQTAFWDLDALYVPQDHPAREMQDTFYLEKPARGSIPAALYKKVKRVHENGGDTGSTGWRYRFSKEESTRNLLRTHTTVLSAQTLYAISQGKAAMPGKYFSVAKVYRNEALDWKHLFEFYQVEGIVVAEGLTFQHLKGYLRAFFSKMGFSDVRIRPGHFPYTEPSAEVDVWDAKRKQWVELGGSGIFRPEVTKTLIGKEVPVLAWGLGMERIIKEYYKLEDIRDLYRNDLEQLKTIKAWL